MVLNPAAHFERHIGVSGISILPMAKRLSKPSALLRAMQASNIAHSTIAFITEFQEAQSFFVIGIAIAIMRAET
jgi:hypothetical protein